MVAPVGLVTCAKLTAVGEGAFTMGASKVLKVQQTCA
jgi:hypothetical protein